MSEIKDSPVKGYTDQHSGKIKEVNYNKNLEESVLKRLDVLKDDPNVDQRWLQIGRTKIEEAFMAINRSIFKPERVK